MDAFITSSYNYKCVLFVGIMGPEFFDFGFGPYRYYDPILNYST
jgi:hypothetical protein